MTKILSSDVIQVGNGKCDFCGKFGVKGPVGSLILGLAKLMPEHLRTVKGPITRTFSLFGGKPELSIDDYGYVPHYVPEVKDVKPLICWECIHYLNKLIPKK